MPQPDLPAPLAPRPDPGAQLLEAVLERNPQRSLQLAQQWVHRRGVHDLQRFCSTRLDGAQGPAAVAWLRSVLALDAPIPLSPEASPSSAQVEAVGIPIQLKATGTAQTSLDEAIAVAWEEAAGPTDDPAQQDLQARAVAAVDEAFAALAQSFQEEEPAIAPTSLAGETSTAPVSAPPPVPVRSGLWPSLRASAASFSAALRPVRHNSPGPLDGTPEEKPASDADADAAPPEPQECGLDDEAIRLASPQPQTTSPTLAKPQVRVAASGEAAAEAPPQLLSATQVSSDPSASVALSPAQATSQGQKGPLQRLRGRIQMGRLPRLSRLRAVMQDCVEETVALLRTPTPEHHEDDGVFDVSQPPQPAWTPREQPSLSWTLDPFLPPSPIPVASSDPPSAGRVADSPAPAPSRPRFSLPVSKPASAGDRPAPAPDALSDLRAWLPDRGDLPRAS